MALKSVLIARGQTMSIFFAWGQEKLLSLLEFDECETHLILRPFFMHI